MRLVADGCGGQNKNSNMMTMASYWLLKNAPPHVTTVEFIFPVAGHSFIPPDRVFAQVEMLVRKKETIMNVEEYHEIQEKFGTIIKLGSDNCPVYDWKCQASAYLKPPGQWHFKFNESKRFIISKRNNKISIRGEVFYKTDTGKSLPVVRRGKNLNSLKLVRLNNGVLIKHEKKKDVEKLLSKHFGNGWRDMETLEWYRQILDGDTILPEVEYENDVICESSSVEQDGFQI